MKHSDLKKHRMCNEDVVCSGNRKCHECKYYLKNFKRKNNKGIRRLNKSLCLNVDVLTD